MRVLAVAMATVALAAVHWSVAAQELQVQLTQPLDLQPVAFNDEVKESIGVFTNVANTIFKPSGAGPFPAVVLMHTCGGLKGGPNAHMKQHAQESLAAGYVVLVIDSFGPRGFDNCSTRVLGRSSGIADAYAALAFLAAKPFVDAGRIYQAGYSWGAFISTLLASPQSATLVGAERRFAATVANYGSCAFKGKQLLLQDMDRPLLMLMGGRDDEVPAAPCFPLLDDLKAAGKPVQWHVYPNATHAWDKSGQANRGYVFNPTIAKDATARMLGFLNETR